MQVEKKYSFQKMISDVLDSLILWTSTFILVAKYSVNSNIFMRFKVQVSKKFNEKTEKINNIFS